MEVRSLSPRIQIRRIVRRVGTLETAAARAQQRLLRAAQREILAELAGGVSMARAFQLRSILAHINRYVDQYKGMAERAAAVNIRDSWRLGIEMANAGLGEEIARGLYGLSNELLDAIVETTCDQIRGVWSELGTRLKSTVRRVTLGIDDPQQAMATMAKALRDKKGFGTALNRAEVIVRTEVNRTFSSGQQKRLEQATATGVKARKYWLTAHDNRVRPDHVKAGVQYGPSGAIPVDKPFYVGGEPLQYPGDPRASAEQTINCRCVHLAVVED